MTRILHFKGAGTAAMARLVIPLTIKSADGAAASDRTFEGLSAVWDLDLGGDIIHKGAFKKSIADWRKSKDALPLLNSHNHFDIMSAVGQLVDAKEVPEGLWTKWEVVPGPDGDKVLERLRPSPTTKRAVISKLSIGFIPTKFDFEQPEDSKSVFDRLRHLREVDWEESSLVLFPMAPGAAIDSSSVKSFIEATRVTDPTTLSVETKQELRRLASRIGALLATRSKKSEDASGTDEPDDDSETADSPKPPGTPPASDEDEETDESEDSDTDVSTDADDDQSTDDPPDEPVTPPAPPAPKAEPKGRGGEYLFGEALQQRLRGTLLRNKVSNITTHQD